jgi:hypothetical protein
LLQTKFRPVRGTDPNLKKIEEFIPGKIERAEVSVNALPAGGCYWAADAMKDQYPELTVTHGWLVSVWPGLLVEFMHHALLRKPDMSLIDPSSYPYGSRPTVSFVADEGIAPPRNIRPFIYNRYLLISPHPDVRALAEVSGKQSDVHRAIAELAQEQGIAHASAETPVNVPPELHALDAHLRSEVDRLMASLNSL